MAKTHQNTEKICVKSNPDTNRKFYSIPADIDFVSLCCKNSAAMKWITRERPKIDRIACPWLIKNFVDPEAEFIYVPSDQVFNKAKELNAVPYDIPGAEYSHKGDFCTFDYIIKKHKLDDPALYQIALIVRGADTDSFELAPQAAGLWAISAGLSYNIRDDHEQLAMGIKIYDALYSWAKYIQDEKHTWSPEI